MDKPAQPSKEQVRQWLLQRRERREPLPTADQIRRQLGWGRSAGEFRAALPIVSAD
jgi:hypothetical protein